MQPITVNTEVIGNLFSNWANAKSQREFYKLTENLEQFHQVYIDKNNGGSNWLNKFREIRNSIGDQNIKKLFDDLIGPRNIKYVPVKIIRAGDYFYELTLQTPDKIGLNQNNQSFGGVEYYDLSVFNSNEWVAQCLLFRVPKTIHILPSYTFHNLRIFSPYLRTAEEIEFCDLFLFESAKFYLKKK